MPPNWRNLALIKPSWGTTVVSNFLIRPYFLGGGVCGIPLDYFSFPWSVETAIPNQWKRHGNWFWNGWNSRTFLRNNHGNVRYCWYWFPYHQFLDPNKPLFWPYFLGGSFGGYLRFPRNKPEWMRHDCRVADIPFNMSWPRCSYYQDSQNKFPKDNTSKICNIP